MIQFQNDPFNMIEAKLSHLENMSRNVETLPTTSNHIDENKKSWNLENFDQDSISLQNFEFDQYQPNDKLASFYFNELNSNMNVNPTHNSMIQFQSLNLC